jgi:translation initiation factor IF-2
MTTKKPTTPKKKDDEKDKTAKVKVAKTGDAAKKKPVSKKKKVEEEEEERTISLAPIVSPPKAQPKPVVVPVAPTPAPVAATPKAAAPAAAPKTAETPKAAEEKEKPKAPAAKPKDQFRQAARPAPRPVQPAPHQPRPAATPEKPKAKPRPHFEPVSSRSDLKEMESGKKKLRFNEMMTVKDLAEGMDVKVGELIKKLLTLGTPATINQRLETDIATLLAESFGFEVEFKSVYKEETVDQPDKPENLKSRPPVVTIMGHVDHGKTSLLDAIRTATVASGEAGGITQHIGAYQVKTEKGVITFLDTPGHEAFTAMRARGAKSTDLVVLVVAADDSVMPQTIEAINHARAAGVPIVVAINKVDLPVANVQKVKQELTQQNLIPEDWGGKTVMVEVSAKTKKNLDKLLEMILLETELLELKANPDRPARGVVLEAKVDPKRGVTATILVQAGTLNVGDIVVCGLSSGRVRAMLDDKARQLKTAGPSTPVAVLGLAQVPQVGDQLVVVSNDREAREIAERRRQNVSEGSEQKSGHLSLESLHDQIAEGKLQELKAILKADVQGSMQAIQDSLGKIQGTSIQIKFVHSGIGNINESDVLLAEAADAIVFGFNVKVEGGAETEAKRAGVDIRTYEIIYEMLADVKAAMEGLLKPEEREAVKGRAFVKTVFPSSRYGKVAGCMVQEGKLTRGQKARIMRNGKQVGGGTLVSLKRFKDDVKEVEKGYECGLSIEGASYEVGDVIEVFVIEKHARRLEG